MKNSKPSSSSSKPSSSFSQRPQFARKSRWESSNPNPSTSQETTPKPSNPKKDSDIKDHLSSSTAIPGSEPPPISAAAGGVPPFGPGIPPPPTYGFQNLERRTIVLADGTARTYFALPPDYPLDPYSHGGRPNSRLGPGFDRFSPDRFREPSLRDFVPPPDIGLPQSSTMKRKFPEEDEFAWHRQHVSQFGNINPILNPNLRRYEDDAGAKQARLGGGRYDDDAGAKQARLGGGEGYNEDLGLAGSAVIDVDPQALNKAFLKFVKMINENVGQKKNYLEDGKNGPFQCIVCGRAPTEFADVHGLIMHAYSSQNPEMRVDHLGLHKALCVLMGWNYAKAPENTKAYQSFSADDASENREDLVLWPPTVIIHNTNTGRRKDGRMEGMGNKEMDTKLRDLGFGGGKSKSVYGKEGHLGITLVKYANTQAGLKEAERLSEYFEKDGHGRKGWASAQASQPGGDDENNPALVKVDPKSGEKKRILYGYLATAFDLETLDFDMRKKAVIKSRREVDSPE